MNSDEWRQVLDDEVGEIRPGLGVTEVGEGKGRFCVRRKGADDGGCHHREAQLVVEGIDVW